MLSIILNSALGVIFAVTAVLSFCGKSANLIAGYNTASEEEKAKYDEKKLCNGLGIITAIIAVLEFSFAFISYLVLRGTIAMGSMRIFIAVYMVIIIAAVAAYIACFFYLVCFASFKKANSAERQYFRCGIIVFSAPRRAACINFTVYKSDCRFIVIYYVSAISEMLQPKLRVR